MTNINEFFSSSVIPALGWTLLHSLWQSLLCIVVVITLLRCIPSKLSRTRYTIATGGLLLIFLASAGTFLSILNLEIPSPKHETSLSRSFYTSSEIMEFDSITGFFNSLKSLIQSNMTLIVIFWSIGSILSAIRLFSGWWYLQKLRYNAMELDNTWSVQLQKLAKEIGINKWVTLAESPMIHAPIMIGYLKPIILVPVGMCSGLSTEQLESIFIHELIHIRRGDYVVNMIQVLLEALFFFNPFVWIISGIMRREREHCCDDAVVKFRGNPLAYVRALATLEEVRLSNTGLALSLAASKNQLLNRIKRIMEKSVKNYSIRERIVPIVLLAVGVVCASWITIQSGRSDEELTTAGDEEKIVNDTTIKQKDKHYYKRKITTVDENGDKTDEITIEIDGDEELSEMLSLDHNFEFDFEMAVPPMPPMPDIEISPVDVVIPPIPDFDFSFRMDGLAPPAMQFEKFSKEFEETFRERFGCTPKTSDELESMMEKMEFKFDPQFENDWALKMGNLALKQEQLAHMQTLKLGHMEELIAQHEIQAKSAQESVKQIEQEHTLRAKEMEHMKVMDDQLKAHEKTQKALFKELTSELIKDGYLKEGEKISRLQINENKMAFNDKEIKSSDLKKYSGILEKYSHGTTEKELRKEFSKALEGRKE